MSTELSHRLDELSQKPARLQGAIRRIGHSFASSLERTALLEVALKTGSMRSKQSGGRVSLRSADDEPLAETARRGRSPALKMSSSRPSRPLSTTAGSERSTQRA